MPNFSRRQKLTNHLRKLFNELEFPELPSSFNATIKAINELSEGNVNQVFQVTLENNFSFIAKYAPPFAYRFKNFKITNKRNVFEAAVLQEFAKRNPNAYPIVYHINDKNHCLF